MTAYEYDNMPEEVNTDALPEALFNSALHALTKALSSGAVLAKEAKAAYAYNRKGYISLDGFGRPRNRSYSSDTDDVVLQITVRVPSPKYSNNAKLDLIADLADMATDLATQAEREQLEAEIAAAEAAAARAEEEARQKRERLNALRSK